MKRLIILSLCILTSVTTSYAANQHNNHYSTMPQKPLIDDGGIGNAQQNNPEAKQVEMLVEQAAAYTRKHGRTAAVCAFNNSKGPFQKDKNYVFAFVCHDNGNNGFFLADPATPKYNFQQRMSSPLVAGMMEAVEHSPSGIWYHYCWYDPETGMFERKQSYIKMIPEEKLCVGAGYYVKNERCVTSAL